MWRLRTTFGLSLLSLLLGVAGTTWLSAPGGGTAALTRGAPAVHRAERKPRFAVATRPRGREAPALSTVAAAPPRMLVPLSMPADTSRRWDDLRGHLDGRAVVRLTLDRAGRVAAAQLVQSSGDRVLDGYALDSVRRWRFTPPGDAGGASGGDLAMRFSSTRALVPGAP